MTLLDWYVYGLIAAWILSLSALAWSVAVDSTGVVQAMYVVVILLLVITLLTLAISSIAVALKRFEQYWQSGFPVLLAMFFLGYGVSKSTLTPMAFAVGIGSFVVGYAIAALTLTRNWLRFVPMAAVVTLLTGSEATALAPGIKAAVFLLCSGLVVAANVKMRISSDVS
jgi:hypothetical protein